MTEFQSHGHGNRRFRAPTNVSDLRKVEKFAGNVKTIENQLLFDEGITAKGLIPAKVEFMTGISCKIALLRTSAAGLAQKERDKSCDLSHLVEQTIEISNEFIKGFRALMEFYKRQKYH